MFILLGLLIVIGTYVRLVSRIDVDYTGTRYLLIIGEWGWQPKRLDNQRCQEYLDRFEINASLQIQRIQVTGSPVFGEVSA